MQINLQFIKKLLKKFPSRQQWQNLPGVLTKKERYFIFGLMTLTMLSLFGWIFGIYLKNTIPVADYGGSFKEGIAGSPQYINPVLSQANDADRDITELIFSGLLKYNSKDELVSDLAETYNISADGKTYKFFLKKDIKWHDDQPVTADDIVFTIKIIQNPDYRSPVRINWTGVDVEKIDDFTVQFKLKTPYAPFLANNTIGILAKHIWEKIPPINFALTPENLSPVGTGPYKFKKIIKDKEGFVSYIELEAFNEYKSPKKPYIDKISLYFYPDEESLIRAFNHGKFNNLSLASVKDKELLKPLPMINTFKLILPRYFAVFFNQSKNKALADKTVRLALNYATDKNEIIDKILNNEGKAVNSPIPMGVWGHTEETKIYDFAIDHAKNILEAAGWKDENNDNIREKGGEKLQFELITTELKELQQVANLLQEQWQKIGAEVNVKILTIGEIQQQYIRPREYQALLFGEVLGLDPDPFSFWHSSQKKDPGLNLSLYDNKIVDDLLRDARQALDPITRAEKYKKFQQLVVDDAPVVFLYSSYQLYFVAKKIKGIEIESVVLPSKRFADIENWYINTKRVKK